MDTAVVSDTTDDLCFLNEATSDNFSVTVPSKTVDCVQVNEERKEDNTVVSPNNGKIFVKLSIKFICLFI